MCKRPDHTLITKWKGGDDPELVAGSREHSRIAVRTVYLAMESIYKVMPPYSRGHIISGAMKQWRLCWDGSSRSKTWERTGGGATGNIGVETLASTYRLCSHKLESSLCIWREMR